MELKPWAEMGEKGREEAYERFRGLSRAWEGVITTPSNPKCPECNHTIDWVTFPGTCSIKAKVVGGQVIFRTSGVEDWDPVPGLKELYCNNCGEDIHTLVKEA